MNRNAMASEKRTTQKHIVMQPLSVDERKLVLKAKRLAGKTAPAFYHDAIVEAARRTLSVTG